MKILHVIASLSQESGGPAKAILEMAAVVAERGHQVTIYTTDHGGEVVDIGPARAVGVEVQIFPVQFPYYWKRSSKMGAALKENCSKFDVVHIHSLYLYHSWVAGSLCQKQGVPYIVRPHGTLDPYLYRRHRLRKSIMDALFQNRVLRNAAAIHFTTEEEMNLATRYVFGTPGQVVPNGLKIGDYIDLPEPGSFRLRYPETNGRRIVLFLSRLNFKKGLDILVPAFAAASKKYDDLHLVIAGPDEGMKSKVLSWVSDNNIGKRVTFTGMLRGNETLAAFRDAELFALPSYSENFGIAVVEAMACGVPVIISDKVNIWHEIDRAGAGIVVPAEVSSFSNALIQALGNESNLLEMGQQAKLLAAEKFDWSAVAESFENMYALASNSASTGAAN